MTNYYDWADRERKEARENDPPVDHGPSMSLIVGLLGTVQREFITILENYGRSQWSAGYKQGRDDGRRRP